jgi:TetR/AcrR family transcriptional repressor of nem operon
MSQPAAAERIVDQARRLFHVQGYHHTSPDQVMAAAQVSKSTFYYHFRSKEALSQAALEAQERFYWEQRLMPTVGDTARPAPDRLRDWFAVAAEAFESRGFRGGCPFAIVGLEVAEEHAALREQLQRILNRWRAPLTACLTDGIASGHLRDDLSVATLADILIAQYEGAMVLAVIGRTAEPLRQAAATLPLLLAPCRPTYSPEAQP